MPDAIRHTATLFGLPPVKDLEWVYNGDSSAFKFLLDLKSEGVGVWPKAWPDIYPHVEAWRFTPEFKEILGAMLAFNPDKRCSAQDALAYPYLKEVRDPDD